MTVSDAIELEAYYSYGFEERQMIAVRAPFPMGAEASEIVGRRVKIGRRFYDVLGVARQVAGPIQKGEPIGVEVRELRAEAWDGADPAACPRL